MTTTKRVSKKITCAVLAVVMLLATAMVGLGSISASAAEREITSVTISTSAKDYTMERTSDHTFVCVVPGSEIVNQSFKLYMNDNYCGVPANTAPGFNTVIDSQATGGQSASFTVVPNEKVYMLPSFVVTIDNASTMIVVDTEANTIYSTGIKG